MANSENIDISSILNEAFKAFKKANEFNDEMDKETLNVFILGKSGAGKSTLINCVFGENVAETGSGSPKTRGVVTHKKDKLTIFDTEGFELNGDQEEKIKEFVDENVKEDPEEQIHVAWLCISEPTRRVEELEIRLYEMLKEKGIPTFIVITKAERNKDENDEKFDDICKEKFSVSDEFLQRVRAIEIEDDEGEKKAIMGIDKLINKTYLKLPEAQKKAFARKQKFDEEMRLNQIKEDVEGIVKYYSAAAGAAATAPIPLSDFYLILPTQIAMIIHISSKYGLEFTKEKATKLATGLFSVCAAGFGLKLAVGSVLKIMPGLGSVAGGAINAGIASSSTLAMGKVYSAYLRDNYDDIFNGIFDIDIEKLKIYFQKNKEAIESK